MDLVELQRNWNAFGESDPFGAILTEPDKIGGKWDRAEFFRKGVEEISEIMDYIHSVRLGTGLKRGEALDFGCGVGRLTQALCDHFERCSGVDIAPSMIRLANRYNQCGARCRYYLNEVDDLAIFEDGRFAFIYSNIVLQHMKPEYSRRYIQEFLRVLAPGGLLIFQLPSKPQDPNTQTQPLPDSGFRASLHPVNPPSVLRPGSQATFRVRLKNLSDATWPAMWDGLGRYNVTIGNRWLDPAGKVLVPNDGRSGLPHDLGPGDEAEIPLTLTAPRESGCYVLELDAIQEQWIWFHQKGSQLARHTVRVKEPSYQMLSDAFHRLFGPAPANSQGEVSSDTQAGGPIMEMYGIEHSEVVELIERNAGQVIDTKIWPTSSWVHARYCVTK
jgi:SAM-dependent methyltransferase